MSPAAYRINVLLCIPLILMHKTWTSRSATPHPNLLLLDVGAGGLLYGRVLLAAYARRLHLLAGAGLEPVRPVLPPGALVFGSVLPPLLGGPGLAGVAALVDPVSALALGGRVDHARDVAAIGKGEAGLGVGELPDLPRRVPRDDVVLLGPNRVDLTLYLAEIYGPALYLHLARLYEVVLEVGVAEVEAVGVARHARAVCVPVQEVEGWGLLAQEVVVDNVSPDQLARAQEVEHVGHLAVIQVAALHHGLLHELDLRLVYEHRRVPDVGEVLQRDHEGRGVEGVLVAACGEPGLRDREQRPTDAVADRVHLLRAGYLPDDLGGGEGTLRHVVLELGLLHRGVGVLPGDHEDREALFHEVPDHALLVRKVEDVVPVNPGRQEYYGRLVDLLGRGLVLDELDEIVAVDDLARRHGDVLAELEGRGIRHAEAPLFEVSEQVPRSFREARSSGLGDAPEGRGVGEQEVDRRHRVHELPEVEPEPPLLLVVLAVCLLGLVHQVLGGEQIRLLERLVVGVALPLGLGEALVRPALLFLLLLRQAPEPGSSVAPYLHCGLEEALVVLGRPPHRAGRVAQLAHPQRLQGACDLSPVDRQHVLHGVGVPQPLHGLQQRVVPYGPLGQSLGRLTSRYSRRRKPGDAGPGGRRNLAHVGPEPLSPQVEGRHGGGRLSPLATVASSAFGHDALLGFLRRSVLRLTVYPF